MGIDAATNKNNSICIISMFSVVADLYILLFIIYVYVQIVFEKNWL